MKRLIVIFSVMAALAQVQVVEADDKMLLGVWSGSGGATEAIYGTMHIGKEQISWGGTNPYNLECKTTYKLVSKYTDTTYPHNTFPLVSGTTFTIYKLKLEVQPCSQHQVYLLFALPSGNEGYAEVVTYGNDEQQTGWHNFSKVSDNPKFKNK